MILKIKKIVLFSLRLLWAFVVLFAICVTWLVLFVVFLPFLIVAALVGHGSEQDEQSTAGGILCKVRTDQRHV